MNIIQADTPEHVAAVRTFFREYEIFLNLDLRFQDFENELDGLPGKYAPLHRRRKRNNFAASLLEKRI